MTMKIEQVKITDLAPYERNSRTHSDEQISQIMASIREFGFTNPVLIDGDNRIIAGHGRMLAAAKMGIDTVPCLRFSNLTDSQIRAYVIADNKLAENAGWDRELLQLEMGELQELGFDLDLLGFTRMDLKDIFAIIPGNNGLTDPDSVPDVPMDPVTNTGDVWQLGHHRLLCGDSTKLDEVQSLMGGGYC